MTYYVNQEEDISKIDELIESYEYRTKYAARLSYPIIIATVFLLRRKNKILQLTKKYIFPIMRVNWWEIMKKYFIAP